MWISSFAEKGPCRERDNPRGEQGPRTGQGPLLVEKPQPWHPGISSTAQMLSGPIMSWQQQGCQGSSTAAPASSGSLAAAAAVCCGGGGGHEQEGRHVISLRLKGSQPSKL